MSTLKLSKRCIEIQRDLEYNAKNSHDTVKFYSQWAEDYENDELAVGYNIHLKIVEFLETVVHDSKLKLNKSSKIIDIAAGTGLVGEVLRKRGFSGQIDALDGSQGMLQVAKEKKGIYNQAFCHVIEPEIEMPAELSSGQYDILIVCCAMVRPNVIHQECLQHFVNCVRPGGVIIFSLRNPLHQVELDYNVELTKVAFRLEQAKTWQLLDVKYLKSYRANFSEMKEDRNPGAFFHCYQKSPETE